MDTRWRQGMIFAAGLALGGTVVAVAMLGVRDDDAGVEKAQVATQAQPVAVAAPRVACDFPPVVAASGRNDGKVTLVDAGPGKTSADLSAAIVQGKEAAAAGRDRDAEAAFLSACRIAARVTPDNSVELADAKYQLARHYAMLARERAPGRSELLKRSKSLYGDSLRTYLARLGDSHEKSRFAAEGLASVRQESVQAVARAPSTPTPQTMPAPKAAAEKLQRSEPMGAAQAQVDVPQPSFDCDRAQSTSEKLICSDAQLAQLDRDLGTLYARAKRSAIDLDTFQRVSDREWRRRESECGDRDCLLRWYAQRRAQLQDVIETAGEEQASVTR